MGSGVGRRVLSKRGCLRNGPELSLTGEKKHAKV